MQFEHYFGFDSGFSSSSGLTKDFFEEQAILDYPATAIVILYWGSVVPYKNHMILRMIFRSGHIDIFGQLGSLVIQLGMHLG